MGNKKNYVTYREISEKTRIQEKWLRDNIPADFRRMFPQEKNTLAEGKVCFTTFKKWMVKSKLLPHNSMLRHMGVSQGQLCRMRNNDAGKGGTVDLITKFIVPTVRGVDLITEEKAEELILWHLGRGLKKPYCLQPGICQKPRYITWPDKGTVVIPTLPIPEHAKHVTTMPTLRTPPATDDKQTTLPVDPPHPPPATEEDEEKPQETPTKEDMVELTELLDRMGKPKVVRFKRVEVELEF